MQAPVRGLLRGQGRLCTLLLPLQSAGKWPMSGQGCSSRADQAELNHAWRRRPYSGGIHVPGGCDHQKNIIPTTAMATIIVIIVFNVIITINVAISSCRGPNPR